MAPQYHYIVGVACLILVQVFYCQAEEKRTEPDSAQALCNQTDKFLCKISKQCIDRRFVCDFGRDCGPLDDSDEADCSDYQGRCDFEEPDRCGWIATHDSWLWVDAQVPVKDRPQPVSDHRNCHLAEKASGNATSCAASNLTSTEAAKTPCQSQNQTDECNGHFMLINPEDLKEFDMAELLGPRVQLKPGHLECNIRFWLNTKLENFSNSSYLVAGFEHLRGTELFSHEKTENGWRRFEILLFQRGLDRPPHYTLHISFGNLSKDLNKFKTEGYLALDDLSFSPGCQLAYYEYADNKSICPQNQRRCSMAPHETPETFCVPQNRICDFKADCGIDASKHYASDETGCPKECRLDGSTAPADCGLELDEEKILSLANASSIANLANATLMWPYFSQAHANCALQLDYAFSPDARNLAVFITIVTREKPDGIYYATIFAHSQPDKEAGSKQMIELGLGEQRLPFRVQVRVEAETDSAGTFNLLGYKFTRCEHPAGLLDVLKSPIIMKTGDDEGDDDDDDDAWLFDVSRRNQLEQSLACPKGQFQCHSPILCLPESLQCDMQVDCQDSAQDESDCATLGARQYNFEQDGMGEAPSAWTSEQAESISGFWEVWKHKRWDRIDLHSGPPVDHTSSSPTGKFLTLRARKPESYFDSIQALIYAPKMKMKPTCKRLVFYFYYWQGALRRQPNSVELRVFISRSVGQGSEVRTDLLYELPGDELSERDRWQRVELQLPQVETNGSRAEVANGEFRLAFFGRLHGIKLQGDVHNSKVQGRDSIFAIDDVAFNLECELADPAGPKLELSLDMLSATLEADGVTRVYVGRPFLMLLVLAFIVVVVATYFNSRRLRNYRRMAKTDPDQDAGLSMARL